MSVTVVEAKRVNKRYGSTVALRDVSMAIQEGSTHGLVGRNGAGKSTLVAVLTGLVAPDSGEVLFSGAPAPGLGDRNAWRERVACVYQKSTIIPTLSVAENLYLNRQSRGRLGLIGWSGVRREARRLLESWSVHVDVSQPASALNVEQRQLVEIARALSFGARFIILDEPTAQLDGAAIRRLFDRLRALRHKGVTFLFISHHLQEVYDICDTVTVLRDAEHVMTAPVSTVARPQLVSAMTGDNVVLPESTDRAAVPAGAAVVLAVDDLVARPGAPPVTFDVRAGEAVGLAGGGGSGKVEVAEALVGLRRPAAGWISVNDRILKPGSVPDALDAGVGWVPQDRHREGLVPLLSVAENITMTVPEQLRRGGLISPGRRDEVAGTMIDALTIKTPGPQLPVAGLSGGNQQKVVMARALASDPTLLVLITPTAGVDVRSK